MYLCVERTCKSEAAELEPGVKLLGKDECVWTERVSAERRLAEVSYVLHLTHTGSLEGFAHLINAAEER